MSVKVNSKTEYSVSFRHSLLYVLCKHFIIHKFTEDPKQNARSIFGDFKRRVVGEWSLISCDEFDDFIDTKGELLSRYLDDHERSARGWFFQIFQHGGSERFTYGALDSLKTIFHKIAPVLGRWDIGNADVFNIFSLYRKDIEELTPGSESRARILNEVKDHRHNYSHKLGETSGDDESGWILHQLHETDSLIEELEFLQTVRCNYY